MLQHYVGSALAAADFPTALYAFSAGGEPIASLKTANLNVPMDAVRRTVAEAIGARHSVVTSVSADPATVMVLAVPSTNSADSGTATVVVLAPKTLLIHADPFNRLYGLEVEPEGAPPYTLQLSPIDPARSATARSKSSCASRWRWSSAGR